MILYNCCNCELNDEGYIITKFDDDFNVESSYRVTVEACECPAGVRDTCRHRKMLPIFIATEHIDDNWFYNYDTHGWHKIDQSDPFVDQDVVPAGLSEKEIEEGTEVAVDYKELITPEPETSLRRRI